jgi:pimeloyl-ACP methyl ester carboxylesterase
MVHYDEFGLFHENAAEVGLPWSGPPTVRRTFVRAPSGHDVSALVWGEGPAELVLLHGGAQNAHTWDTVALALDRPLVAIDLPGHGHSEWRATRAYRPQEMAEDIGFVMGELAPDARVLGGMSLGGLTATVVAASEPTRAEKLVVVDVTPGVDREKAKDIVDFISGPEEFESFDEILERTVLFNPTRSESSLRRGILHNAKQRDDGKWVWRYDLPLGDRTDITGRFADLWDAVEAVRWPMLLVQGATSPVVDEADVAELRRRQPDVRHVVVADAGHSVQGDQPLELARLLTEVLES